MADPSAPLTLLEACWRDLVLEWCKDSLISADQQHAHLKVVPVLLGWATLVCPSLPRFSSAASLP